VGLVYATTTIGHGVWLQQQDNHKLGRNHESTVFPPLIFHFNHCPPPSRYPMLPFVVGSAQLLAPSIASSLSRFGID